MKRKNDSRNYRYSLFLCPHCNKQVIKQEKFGLKAKVCSHKCYSKTRGLRGKYKESILINGYRYILSSGHPNATKKGYMAEHRLIAEKLLGRYLYKCEDVHHTNFNKLDNSENNLIVLSKSEHMKLHAKLKRRNLDGCF